MEKKRWEMKEKHIVLGREYIVRIRVPYQKRVETIVRVLVDIQTDGVKKFLYFNCNKKVSVRLIEEVTLVK